MYLLTLIKSSKLIADGLPFFTLTLTVSYNNAKLNLIYIGRLFFWYTLEYMLTINLTLIQIYSAIKHIFDSPISTTHEFQALLLTPKIRPIIKEIVMLFIYQVLFG